MEYEPGSLPWLVCFDTTGSEMRVFIADGTGNIALIMPTHKPHSQQIVFIQQAVEGCPGDGKLAGHFLQLIREAGKGLQ
jgi:hypothetical protein